MAGFDHPTDTLLSGIEDCRWSWCRCVETNLTWWRKRDDPSPGEFVFKIMNLGLPQLVICRGEDMFFRSGMWNGLEISSTPSSPNSIFQPDWNFSKGSLVSVTRPYNSSLFTRFEFDSSGLIHWSTISLRRDMWNHAYTLPHDRCDEYGYCSAYAICSFEKEQRCECFKGFSPKVQNDWNLQDWSGGCRRVKTVELRGWRWFSWG